MVVSGLTYKCVYITATRSWPSLPTWRQVDSYFPLSCDGCRLRTVKCREKWMARYCFVIYYRWSRRAHSVRATRLNHLSHFHHCRTNLVPRLKKTWGRCQKLPIIIELFPVPVAAYYSQLLSAHAYSRSSFVGIQEWWRITNLKSENVCQCFNSYHHFCPDDGWSIQSKRRQMFSDSSCWQGTLFHLCRRQSLGHTLFEECTPSRDVFQFGHLALFTTLQNNRLKRIK